MSVIKFTPQEFATIINTLKGSSPTAHRVRSSILYSKEFLYRSKYDKGTENEVVDKVIESVIVHLWKANLFCWIANYPRDWKSAEELNIEDFPKGTVLGSSVELLRQLKSLDYNLATNDGNYFVDPDKYKIFQSMIRVISDNLLDSKLYPTNQ